MDSQGASTKIYHLDSHEEVLITSADNLTIWEKYAQAKYIVYDYLPLRQIKNIIGPSTYGIYQYRGNTIHLYGEYHLRQTLKYDMMDSILVISYIKMLIANNAKHMDVYLEVPTLDVDETKIQSITNGLRHYLTLVNDQADNFTLCAADKRYDMDIKSQAWYQIYQDLGQSLSKHGHTEVPPDMPELMEKFRTSDIFSCNFSEIVSRNQNMIRTYLQKICPDHTESTIFNYITETYETASSPLPNLSVSDMSSMIGIYKILSGIAHITKLYSPIMDMFVLNSIQSSDSDVIIYVGQNHARLYQNFLMKKGATATYYDEGNGMVGAPATVRTA